MAESKFDIGSLFNGSGSKGKEKVDAEPAPAEPNVFDEAPGVQDETPEVVDKDFAPPRNGSPARSASPPPPPPPPPAPAAAPLPAPSPVKTVAAPAPSRGPRKYEDPAPAPYYDAAELKSWDLWRAIISEFVATLLFVYIGIQTIIGSDRQGCNGAGTLGIAFAFGATIFVLIYAIGGISGGHINPAVTFGLFLGRRITALRALLYIVFQVLGAICGAGIVKALQKASFQHYGGGTNIVAHGYNLGAALGAEIIGTFVLVYVVYSATDAKRKARDAYVPVLLPIPIGFAVFIVHLATIPITGTGINPARSLGAAIIWDHHKAYDDMWIFWVGPFLGAAIAAAYHQFVIRAIPFHHANTEQTERT